MLSQSHKLLEMNNFNPNSCLAYILYTYEKKNSDHCVDDEFNKLLELSEN